MSLKNKFGLIFIVVHLVFVLAAFYRDSLVFNGGYCTLNPKTGDVGEPIPWLMVSDIYYYPVMLFSFGEKLMKIEGTGGPCTYVSINPSLPYSLIFIIVSSIVYYLLGMIVGWIVGYWKKFNL